MTTAEPKANRPITPLWIVSIFVALVEAIAGFAIINTVGTVQITLTIFVIVYALLVAIAFFLILWKKPFVFYSPTEYGQSITPQEYINALSGNLSQQQAGKPEISEVKSSFTT
ncbi:MAG: hypothetical protein L6461_16850, partial [Anaerolineae bacterium]|nr:hypothetical protein [Anaerolineae bacterium]